MRSDRSSGRDQPDRSRDREQRDAQWHQADRWQQEGRDKHEQDPHQLRQRVPAVKPGHTGDVIPGRGARHASTVRSPRLNIVRTVIGSAARMTKTTVKLIVLSSGSTGQALGQDRLEDAEPERPEDGDDQVRAAAGHATERTGRDRRGDAGGDDARGEPADPDREEPGVLAASRPGERQSGDHRGQCQRDEQAERVRQGEAPEVEDDGIARAVRGESDGRGEVAGGREQEADQREDQGRGRDRRRPDEIAADREGRRHGAGTRSARSPRLRRPRWPRSRPRSPRIAPASPGPPDPSRGRSSPGRRASRQAAAAIPKARARNPPMRSSSERSPKTPRLAQKPASNPTVAATGAKNAVAGPAPPGMGRIDQTRFDSRPVSAPAHGPASAPTRTVPTESR